MDEEHAQVIGFFKEISDDGRESFHPRIHEYLKELERDIIAGRIGDTFGGVRIDPGFFQENLALSLDIFPVWSKRIRNYSGRDFEIESGKFRLELNGNTCVGGGFIYKRGEDRWHHFIGPPFYSDSYGAGQSFVKLVGRRGLKKVLLNDIPYAFDRILTATV